jgi:hypothetical protein
MKKYLLLLLSIILFERCRTQAAEENPLDIAKSFCDCVNSQMKNAMDSFINLNDCQNKIFAQSRLLMIYIDFNNKGNYSQKTRDSASDFALKVRDMEDSICYNKIDFKKVKKIRHIEM